MKTPWSTSQLKSEEEPIITGRGKDNVQNSSDSNYKEEEVSTHSLSVITAGIILVGEIVGTGALSLPKAFDNSGWVGMLLITVVMLLLLYTGKILADTWTTIRQRYPEYRGHVRDPYPVIGQITYGSVGRFIITASIMITSYGILVVMLITVTDNTGEIMYSIGFRVPFLYRLVTLGAIMCPIMWLGSPKDFWFVTVIAAVTSVSASFVMLANVIYDGIDLRNQSVAVSHSDPTWQKVFMTLGTACYSYGGHSVFVTVQTDMKEPSQFVSSVYIAFIATTLIYYPLSMTSYFMLGDRVADNILLSLSPGSLASISLVLLTMHYFTAFVIVISPVTQHIEHVLHIPKEFNLKRCLFRTSLMASAVIIAALLPNFGAMVSLVGGSTLNILCTSGPALFYMKLFSMEGDWEQTSLSLASKLLCYLIVVLGVLSSIACTYFAIMSMALLKPIDHDWSNGMNSTMI